MILVDLRADDPRPKLLKELGVRAVLAGGPDPNNYVPSLSIDDPRTMGTVLEHLSSLGHRRIAYLSGDSNLDYSQGRVSAFSVVRKTAQTGIHQHRVHEFRCRAGRDAYAGDVAFAEASYCIHLRDGNSCRGQSACHGRSIYHRATENREGQSAGYPNGLPAIVSFEDSFICEAAYPSITSAHRDASEYGAKVAKLLLKVLAGEQVSGNRRILTPKLVVRDSTVKPCNSCGI